MLPSFYKGFGRGLATQPTATEEDPGTDWDVDVPDVIQRGSWHGFTGKLPQLSQGDAEMRDRPENHAAEKSSKEYTESMAFGLLGTWDQADGDWPENKMYVIRR